MKKTLVVCDLQPDVVQKLPKPLVDLVGIAVEASRKRKHEISFTMLKFSPNYSEIPDSHTRLGILKRVPHCKWFTSSALCIEPLEDESVLERSTFLPHGEVELDATHEYILVGYGPTVQAMSHILGDVLAVPSIQILRECVADEDEQRCRAFLDHDLLFGQVVSLVDYLADLDLLHEVIGSSPSDVKYVCDCGRGGHLSLFMPYLLRDHGYHEWPTQPWYRDPITNKSYLCPLGQLAVTLCDEPRFTKRTRFFLKGRQYLDEKDLLHHLVPELMPPTFDRLEAASKHSAAVDVWFLKKVNQNGGRAVTVLRELPTEPLEKDEQLQAHVPQPLLFKKQDKNMYKCHVKTYQYICSTKDSWHLYMHDLYYLATANKPWTLDDLSDDVQITTLRTHRLYPEHPWRLQYNLTETCRNNMTTILRRAIEQNKLEIPPSGDQQDSEAETTLQFEINSADWMLSQDGRIYLIECNGIPVLYDGGMPQELCTKGLRLYDKLYKENPETAVVNDHDLIKEALGLALTGKLPKSSLWKHLATIPAR